MKKTYKIEVDCANCANEMEARSAKVAGVKAVSISYMAQKISVEFEDGAEPEDVMPKVLKACCKVDSDCEIAF